MSQFDRVAIHWLMRVNTKARLHREREFMPWFDFTVRENKHGLRSTAASTANPIQQSALPRMRAESADRVDLRANEHILSHDTNMRALTTRHFHERPTKRSMRHESRQHDLHAMTPKIVTKVMHDASTVAHA